MAHNFINANRDQQFLLPPDMREWLPPQHLAYFVIDVVDKLDLSRFKSAYREDGRGAAAYDPAVMVALYLYAYCIGERSSRAIERHCVQDVAYRVISANLSPDHSTIARFRAHHQVGLNELFVQVLGLCAQAGLVKLGTLALDGTKIEANASGSANVNTKALKDLVQHILDEASAIDSKEDELYGNARGDELLDIVADPDKRARFLEEKLGKATFTTSQLAQQTTQSRINTTDSDSTIMKTPKGFCQGYNAQALANENQVVIAHLVTNDNNDVDQLNPMVSEMKHNLETLGLGDASPVVVADAGYYSTDNVLDAPLDVVIAPSAKDKIDQFVQNVYNHKPLAPKAPSKSYSSVQQRLEVFKRLDAAELTQLKAAVELHLDNSTVSVQYGRWKTTGVVTAPQDGRTALVRYRKNLAKYQTAQAFSDPIKRSCYEKRKVIIEPIFGNIKHNRGFRQFMRRGLDAVGSEWALITTTHNLNKLFRSTLAIANHA